MLSNTKKNISITYLVENNSYPRNIGFTVSHSVEVMGIYSGPNAPLKHRPFSATDLVCGEDVNSDSSLVMPERKLCCTSEPWENLNARLGFVLIQKFKMS